MLSHAPSSVLRLAASWNLQYPLFFATRPVPHMLQSANGIVSTSRVFARVPPLSTRMTSPTWKRPQCGTWSGSRPRCRRQWVFRENQYFSTLRSATPQTCWRRLTSLLGTHPFKVHTTHDVKLLSSSSVDQSSLCSAFVAVLMQSMPTYGMVSFCWRSCSSSGAPASLWSHLSFRTSASAACDNNFWNGPDHFKGYTMHTSTDLCRATRPSLLLVLFHRLIRLVRIDSSVWRKHILQMSMVYSSSS